MVTEQLTPYQNLTANLGALGVPEFRMSLYAPQELIPFVDRMRQKALNQFEEIIKIINEPLRRNE
jgi:hypothetical protein